MTPCRRRIWSEYVPYEVLETRALLRALGDRSLTLIVAVTPDLAPGAAGVVRACRDAGIELGLWPMLANADGRWASAVNAARFCGFVRSLIDSLDARAALPDFVAIDLEPSIEHMQRLVHGRWAALPRARDTRPAAAYRVLVAELGGRGMDVFLAVVPPVILAPPAGRGWQWLLGTPVDALATPHVSPMVYTSLFEGYGRGLIQRRDAAALLARLSHEARQQYGVHASVSIGAVGIGALGDEQTYRSVDELAQDVAIVRAAGVEDIALFNLDGVLQRRPEEAWLDALVHTPPARIPVPATPRAAALWQLLRLAGYTSDLVARAFEGIHGNG